MVNKVTEVGKDYPDIALDHHMYVDNAVMQLVKESKRYDRRPFAERETGETPEIKMTLKTEFAVDMTCQSCGKLLT